MIFNKSLLVSSLVLTILSVTSAAPKQQQVKGQIGTIINKDDFCLFLPPMYGGGIAENEDRAVAFCTKPLANAPKAGILPRGFIKTAHFVENKAKGYVQVTGRMDGKKYGLSKNDGGGQYDIKAPRGARCHGYAHFVELVEPDSNIYCIRCCKNKIDCPVNKSTYGCKTVLGGNYA
ncbi:hypothetical protein KVV02_001394 [Mortierella alpina]|uniref:Effector protein n=1 Tax=Mortierella alpina TaxID=64518 RepID=A0A9P8AAA1_MORAP|nr:hypothetical protein BGZ67_006488 [Mortierella alpina]KAG9326870.1 hypothetical protein KVV02_001394 [Mortierella alpina]